MDQRYTTDMFQKINGPSYLLLFVVTFFINGEIGKYQEDYDNGLEYQVTLVCDPGQSITPEVTQTSGVNFNSLPMTEFWGISPDGDPNNILDSSSTIYYTMTPAGKLEVIKMLSFQTHMQKIKFLDFQVSFIKLLTLLTWVRKTLLLVLIN